MQRAVLCPLVSTNWSGERRRIAEREERTLPLAQRGMRVSAAVKNVRVGEPPALAACVSTRQTSTDAGEPRS